ncbi:MAG: DUF424 family protein [Candidatus Micrarchaeota archaeon]
MKAKVHKRITMEGGREVVKRIVAICDEELLGKVFEEGDLVLDLVKYRSFYDGEKVSEGQVADLLEGAMSYNLVGKKSIAAATKAIAINPKGIKTIKGVPHLQIYYV